MAAVVVLALMRAHGASNRNHKYVIIKTATLCGVRLTIDK